MNRMVNAPEHRRFQFSLRAVLLGMAGLAPFLFVLGLALRLPEVGLLVVSFGVFAAVCCIAMVIYTLLFMALMRALEALLDLLVLLFGQIDPHLGEFEKPPENPPNEPSG